MTDGTLIPAREDDTRDARWSTAGQDVDNLEAMAGTRNSTNVVAIRRKKDHKSHIMGLTDILGAAVEYSGLDVEELNLLIELGRASKEATRRATTSTPEETKRLNDIARLRFLELDYYQKSQVVELLPDVLENDAQYRVASQLPSTVQKMQLLQRQLKEPVTERGSLVKKAHSQAMAYYRAVHQQPETPAFRRPVNQVAAPPPP